MYRREIYKASDNEIKSYIVVNVILFVLFTSIFALSEPRMMEFEGAVLYFVLSFFWMYYLYMKIGHDILFDNVKTRRCCVNECTLKKEWRRPLFAKKGSGKIPAKEFFVYVQEVDIRGDKSPIVYEPVPVYNYPVVLYLRSRNIELYKEINRLRNKHIKFRKKRRGGQETDEFLYGEVTYFEKSRLIVGFKYLGTKKYA